MPIIKNAFSSGKMNKDLDERLVPNGEYRDAINVQVTTSDGSAVGALQNILGNQKLSNLTNDFYNAIPKCVGTVSDEKNDAVYWLATHDILKSCNLNVELYPRVEKDVIIEYKNNSITPVAVDVYKIDLRVSNQDTVASPNPSSGGAFDTVFKVQTKTYWDNQTDATSNIVLDYAIGIKIDWSSDITSREAVLGVHENMNLTIISNVLGIEGVSVFEAEILEVKRVGLDGIIIYLGSNTANGANDGGAGILQNLGLNNNFQFNFSNPSPTFNFNKNKIITGLNVLEDFLFFTDNNSEPKKINISRFKEGTRNFYEQTHMFVEYSSDGNAYPQSSRDYLRPKNLMQEHHVSVIKKSPSSAPNLKMISTAGENISCFATPIATTLPNSTNFENGTTGIVKDTFSTHDLGVRNTSSLPLEWQEGDVILLKSAGVSVSSTPSANLLPVQDEFDIRARIIGFSSTNPNIGGVDAVVVLTIEILSINQETPQGDNLTFAVSKEDVSEKLFKDKFCRFGYRWKYVDGEYSCFSPFSEIAFTPGSFDHHPKKGYNLAMSSVTKELIIQDFITPDMPIDVVEVDLLFKDTTSPNVYVVETLRYDDPITPGYRSPVTAQQKNSWNDFGSAFYQGPLHSNELTNWYLRRSKIKGSYKLKSEAIFKALPSNQLLRPFDNVPKKALAQEIVGSRLLYGNYVQNFDLKGHKIKFGAFRSKPYDPVGEEGELGKKSIKSLREYQVGVVYTDKYGRETPVITDDSGGYKAPKNIASDYNKLEVKINGSQPSFAEYYKFYIKETSKEYYNLAMDRIYDAADGGVWISFPSADRNKIDEDTYLILKKANGANNFIDEEAKYKVVAISNEAPVSIKENKKLIGKINAHPKTISFPDSVEGSSTVNATTTSPAGTDSFAMKVTVAITVLPTCDRSLIKLHENTNKLKVRFSANVNSDEYPSVSKFYEVSKITIEEKTLNTDDPVFHIKLNEFIDEDPGSSSFNDHFMYDDNQSGFPGSIAADTLPLVEFYEYPSEDKPEFEGRFFVKIFNDEIIAKNFAKPQENLEFQPIASMPLFYLENDDGANFSTTTVGASVNGVSATSSVMDQYQEWSSVINSWHPTIAANNKKYRWFIDHTNWYAPAKKAGSKYIVDDTAAPSNILAGSGTIGNSYNTASPLPTATRNAGIVNASDYASNPIATNARGSIDISYAGIGNDTYDLPAHAQNFVDKLIEGNYIQIGSDSDKYKIIAVRRQNFVNYNSNTFPAQYSTGFTAHSSQVYISSQRRSTFRLHLEHAIGEGPASSNYHPIASDSANHESSVSMRLYTPFVDFDDGENLISENPAIWETEPKEDIGLDIYYEASNEIPLKLNKFNDQLFIPVGSKVSAHNTLGTDIANVNSTDSTLAQDGSLSMIVLDNKNGQLTVSNVNDSSNLILHEGALLKITHPVTREVMTVSVTKAPEQSAETTNNASSYYYSDVNSFYIDTNHNGTRELNFSNCFSFGNGVESNRIKDSFNLPFIDNGVKVSTITEKPFEEERRSSGLIFSGIYNSKSGVNNINQFVSADGIVKDLNPTYGSIQKLHTRNDDVVAFCEDKVLRIFANKDALFNADGSSNITKTDRVLGHADPFAGEYGISTNPESFVSENFRSYFVDKVRGAVLRLSKDGITPVSDYGMKDWFRDNLKNHDIILGSYDDFKDEYNVTLRNNFFVQNFCGLLNPKHDGLTLSYNEKNRGWVSFKSFVPDMGVSCANSYYTFNFGELYKHHVDGVYNTFYTHSVDSEITFLINEMPTSVKNYKTINYEGTQAKVEKNLDDVKNYYNLTKIDGWYCETITTDQDKGKVPEFLDKEGKWFNYIKGINSPLDEIDLSTFNFQGLGIAFFGTQPPSLNLIIRDTNDFD